MKIINLFTLTFMAVLLCTGFIACTNESDDLVNLNPIEKKCAL